ncbi:glycoside hydrolase family 55 protein [Biscogniauxia marginata]|nr:glycoside hydrolase family 55 protein [Biscogniauxia marginata]
MRFFGISILLALALGEKAVLLVAGKYVDSHGSRADGLDVSAAGGSTLLPRTEQETPASTERGLETRQTAGSYWYETIAHQGISAFHPSSATYKVYRNVRDYGAKGDGKTDDTAAIQRAISDGNRCAPGSCASSSTTNAVVYFSGGTYLVSSSIVDYYATNLIGNPNNMPVLKATAGFTGFGVIDGAQYQTGGALPFGGATNIFWRQVRNFVVDLTAVPAATEATGIHWPTAQATSLQNIVFRMSSAAGTKHQGLFVESGSGGMLNDLTFYGGRQIWDWGWTYKSVSVNNCSVGLDMATRDAAGAETVGSVTFLDGSFANTQVAFNVSRAASSQPASGGSLAIENVSLRNVPTAIQHGPTRRALLAGTTGASTIASWVGGRAYQASSSSPSTTVLSGPVAAPSRPAALLRGDGRYYERSKPSYAAEPASSFASVRAGGARGDGATDDTAALQRVISAAAAAGRIVYFDAGTYKVTRTLLVPTGSRIVGEGYAAVMSSGAFFADVDAPRAVVQVGGAGDTGTVEWSDMIVTVQGAQAGAVLIKWNLAAPAGGSPGGLWDVHTRVGGTKGSNLQVANCAAAPSSSSSAAVNAACVGAYMSLHVSSSAGGLYLENMWLWVADHDVDDASLGQITVYGGRGMLIESGAGAVWLVGTGSEHHTRYQYQFSRTQNIFATQIQTETPYYQPNPGARQPFPLNTTIDDPNFDVSCPSGKSAGNCAEAWGLRVSSSKNVLIYGAGLYSFFNNYNTSCSAKGAGTLCQTSILQYDVAGTKGLWIYNLNTVGAAGMVHRDTTKLVDYAPNVNVFPSTLSVFSS